MSSSEFEKKENLKYKDFITSLVSQNSFCNFRQEKQFDFLFPKIAQDVKDGATSLLDLCCGQGRLIHFLKDVQPKLKIHGVDYIDSLIKEACLMFQNDKNISFETYDALSISAKYQKAFDLTVIYKTISWLPYYETIMAEAIKVTKSKIYITSLFWDGDIDFISKIFLEPSKGQENFSYLNTYSFPKFKSFCLNNGASSVSSQDMKLDIELTRTADNNKLQTYTEQLKNDSFIEFTGPMQLNWKLVEIDLKDKK